MFDKEQYDKAMRAIMTDQQLEELDHRRVLDAKTVAELEELDKAIIENIKAISKVQLPLPAGFPPMTDYDLVTEWPDYDDKIFIIPEKSADLTTTSLKECECGAKHTSFPNDHLSFCPMND